MWKQFLTQTCRNFRTAQHLTCNSIRFRKLIQLMCSLSMALYLIYFWVWFFFSCTETHTLIAPNTIFVMHAICIDFFGCQKKNKTTHTDYTCACLWKMAWAWFLVSIVFCYQKLKMFPCWSLNALEIALRYLIGL